MRGENGETTARLLVPRAPSGAAAATRTEGDAMKKLSLTPETLRVESFPTDALAKAEQGYGYATGLPRTCPECANTSPYATCNRA
jgi:hypothetical protein